MKRTTRRIIFFIATVVFVFSSYSAIMYAQGFKYNFSEGRFFLTGAVSLKTNTTAKVIIDGKEEDTTSLLTNGFGIDGLLPGHHDILIQKDGYYPWTKSIVIEEGTVLNFPHIYLFPQENIKDLLESEINKEKNNKNNSFYEEDGNLYFLDNNKHTLIASGIKGFSLSEDQRKLVWWNRNEVYVIWLENAQTQPFQSRGTIDFITRLGSVIDDITWFGNEDYLIVKSGTKFRVIEIDNRGGANIINI